MSAFVTVALDGRTDDVRVDSWEAPQGPAAAIRLGMDVQLVATNASPELLRHLASALSDLAAWREGVLSAAASPLAVAS